MKRKQPPNTAATANDAERVECNACGAIPGQPCLTSVEGRRAARPHQRRLRDAGLL